MTLQWKNGASWENYSADALASTYAGGGPYVEYPPAQDVGIDGTMAAATGRPRIVINAPWMTDTGFDFWRDRFATATAETAAFSTEAWNERAGAVGKYAGILQRPTHGVISIGASAGATIYRNVRIEIWECATTT